MSFTVDGHTMNAYDIFGKVWKWIKDGKTHTLKINHLADDITKKTARKLPKNTRKTNLTTKGGITVLLFIS